jgi:hypothetical protein
MDKKDKQLLYEDLCARIPYGVIVNVICEDIDDELPLRVIGVYGDLVQVETDTHDKSVHIKNVRPYLRPFESMKDDERSMYNLYVSMVKVRNGDALSQSSVILNDWLNKHHIDTRNLIGQGLAYKADEYTYDLNKIIADETSKELFFKIQ